MTDRVLERLTISAMSLLGVVFFLKQFNLSGWETPAVVAGVLLFIIITAIIGIIFKLGILPSMMISAFLDAAIMYLIYPKYALIMIIIGLILLMMVAWVSENL